LGRENVSKYKEGKATSKSVIRNRTNEMEEEAKTYGDREEDPS